MKQHHYVAIASVTATLGATLFLAGCPGNNPSPTPTPTATPSTGPTTTPNVAKEYLFPRLVNGNYTYDIVTITTQPNTTTTATTSATLVLTTTKLTSTEAIVTMRVDNTPVATYSMVVKNNGVEVTEQMMRNGAVVTTKELYTNDAFTATGATVTAASGSTGAIVVKRIDAEPLSAATESFNTLKLQALEATPNALPQFKWVAKDMGYMGVKATSVSTSSSNGGAATESMEILLRSYTK
ncbi:hypothetical protein D3C86_1142420 [compost metagenome]